MLRRYFRGLPESWYLINDGRLIKWFFKLCTYVICSVHIPNVLTLSLLPHQRNNMSLLKRRKIPKKIKFTRKRKKFRKQFIKLKTLIKILKILKLTKDLRRKINFQANRKVSKEILKIRTKSEKILNEWKEFEKPAKFLSNNNILKSFQTISNILKDLVNLFDFSKPSQLFTSMSLLSNDLSKNIFYTRKKINYYDFYTQFDWFNFNVYRRRQIKNLYYEFLLRRDTFSK